MNAQMLETLCLPETATIKDAMCSFEKSGFQVVLIIDEKRRLIGMATEGDIRRALLQGHGLISPIQPHINRSPISGFVDMTRDELICLLSDRVHFLPVVDREGSVQDLLFYDKRAMIPVATPLIGEKELRYVTDAVLSGWISSQGKYIGQFEEMFAAFCGTKHGVAVSNGTVALHLALTALGIGPGDEVIVPALTFIATANVVRHCHAEPVFVDVCRSNWNIDPDLIEKAITPRTKAIIPVHLYGQPCDMDRIMAIAKRHQLWVVEDAAEAHGAEYHGQRVGSIGDMGCFSFYGNKIITTGEGGIIVTNNHELDEKLRILRDHGMNREKRYWHDVVGFNYRMTNLQAAIGVAQLEKWEQIIAAKSTIKHYYGNCLDQHHLEIASTLENAKDVCWLYTAILKQINGDSMRDVLLDRLKACNIDSRPVFYPIPAMPPYFSEDWLQQYPVASYISGNGFSLPSSADMTEKDLKRTVLQLNDLLTYI
jgi:perosamine synthetase